MRRAAACFAVGLTVACSQSGQGSSARPSAATTPTAVPPAVLFFTTWVPDGKVTSGPEPGYRPAFSGLTGHDIRTADAVIDTTGTSWVIDVFFTAGGASLLARLTRGNVAACATANSSCPERHLGMWLDLTQADTDRWDDPTYASKVSQPFDLECLAHAPAGTVCPKFVSDPLTLQEVDGGEMVIGAAFNQQTARNLATAINLGARS